MANTEVFYLTRGHIKLLRHGYVNFDGSFCWGSIGLNCKRPFGNSDVADDMANILGLIPFKSDDGDVWPKGTQDEMLHLYANELPTALQIILSTGSFEPGRYETEQCNSRGWHRSE